MKFLETALMDTFLIEPERLADERGFFARVWCQDEFARRGLNPRLSQCSISFNRLRGTVRGMHYQVAPHEEAKVVRCTRGAIYDVVVDLRPESPTFRHWISADLTAENRHALYVPERCGHGFQTVDDATEVSYQISVPYNAEAARGVRWDDAAFRIVWPLAVSAISPRDQQYPPFKP